MPSSYNDRLFKNGLRRRLHTARFHWVRKSILKYDCEMNRVLELGCFDGKTLQFLPRMPDSYCGYDANWENGLDLARQTWSGHAGAEFFECNSPQEFSPASKDFDVSICMETLEHIPPDDVDQYLATLAASTRDLAFVTIPNEVGVVFAAKYLAKKIRYGSARDYSLREFMWAALGKLDRVSRDHHKGFDFRKLVLQISKHFHVLEVTGLPFRWLPPALNFTVGVVAVPKHACKSPISGYSSRRNAA